MLIKTPKILSVTKNRNDTNIKTYRIECKRKTIDAGAKKEKQEV